MPTPATTNSTDTVDSQGSTLEYCSTGVGTPDTFLPGLTVVPQINSGEVWETDTDLGDDKQSYYLKNLPEDPDFELALHDKPGQANQLTFTDMVEARTHISIKVTRSSGRVQEFTLLPQDHFAGESSNEGGKQMFGCIGKLQDITWSTVAGA